MTKWDASFFLFGYRLVWKSTDPCKSWSLSKGDLGIPNHQNLRLNGWFVPTIKIPVPFQLRYVQNFTQPFSLHLYPLQGLWWLLQISDGGGGGGSRVSCCSQPRYVCLAPCDAHFVSQFGLYGKPGGALAKGWWWSVNTKWEMSISWTHLNRPFTRCLGGCRIFSLVCIWEYNFTLTRNGFHGFCHEQYQSNLVICLICCWELRSDP